MYDRIYHKIYWLIMLLKRIAIVQELHLIFRHTRIILAIGCHPISHHIIPMIIHIFMDFPLSTIHFDGILPYKPAFLGYPMTIRTPPYCLRVTPHGVGHHWAHDPRSTLLARFLVVAAASRQILHGFFETKLEIDTTR